MKLQLTHLLFPALLTVTTPTFADPQATAELEHSRPEAGVLQLQGTGPGVVIVGRAGPGGEFIGSSRLPFVCDSRGRAGVTLTTRDSRPGTLVRTQFLIDRNLGLAAALPLAAEHVFAGAGDLEILAVTPTSADLRNSTRFEVPLDDATFANESGESVVLPAGRTLPAGAIVRVHFGPSGTGADLTAPALAGLGASRLRLFNGADELVAEWAPATAGPSSTTTASMLGAASSWGGSLVAEDLPDAAFLDSNGDGIDGDLRRAIFVDGITGSPTGDGSIDQPLDTLQAAIDLAAVTAGKDHVYVSRGTYTGVGSGAIVLVDGVSIWGGYDASRGWRRKASFTTRIHAYTPVAEGMVGVRAEYLAGRVTLGDLLVTTAHTSVSGMHTYGIKAWQASDLQLDRLTVQPGRGGSGQSGSTITPASTASGGTGGSGGGAPLVAGKQGKAGGSSCSGQAGGGGGTGGTGGGNGSPGSSGATGFAGLQGSPGSNAPSIVGSVLVVQSKGGDGTAGQCGSGGGGGGGGSGGLFNTGGTGGKGGSSGRGGAYGTGGWGGGSSVGLIAVDSHVTLNGGSVISGDGGSGGAGGARAKGLQGSSGSNGQVKSGAGDGGPGGPGGKGGDGGFGSGGGGGHSLGVVIASGSSVQQNAVTIGTGVPGFAGLSGGSFGLFGQAIPVLNL